MKAVQYTFVFVGGCCFVVVAIFVFLMGLTLLRGRTTAAQIRVEPEVSAAVPVATASPAAPPLFTAVNLFVPAPTRTAAALSQPALEPTRTPVAPALEVAPPTPLVLAAATPVVRIATANRKSEVYSGPGVDFPIIGSVAAKQSLTIVMSSTDGIWYELAGGGWIGAYIVDSLLAADLAQTMTLPGAIPGTLPGEAPATVAVPVAAPGFVELPAVPNSGAFSMPLPVAASSSVAAPAVVNPPVPVYAPVPVSGLTYQQVCVVDEGRMTDLQLAAFAGQYVGQRFTDWMTWVYDVEQRDGRYDLSLSMEGPRYLWQRDIVVENIPQDLAFALDVEQPLLLSGRIARNEILQGVCKPLVVDSYVFRLPQSVPPVPTLASTAVPQVAATATPVPTPRPTSIPTQQWGIGQDVMVGNVRWRIISAENLNNRLKSDNLFLEAKTTAGKFIRVSFELENRGPDPLSYTGMELVDHQGRSFADFNEGNSYVSGNERCTLVDDLKPNLPKLCTVIFEVAADATGLRANVNDLASFGTSGALIDLGF